jgi:collagenase-like PrtC family protease
VLPQLMAMGVAAIKIEGRQRSAAYVQQVTAYLARGDRPRRRCPRTFPAPRRPNWTQP